MMRTSRVIHTQYKMWNFVTASRALEYFLVPEGDEHDKKREFIDNIKKELMNAHAAVRELLVIRKRFTSSLSEIDITETAQRYQNAHYVAFEYALEILKMIDAELCGYHANSASDSENQYMQLLIELRNCCLGIMNNEFTHFNWSATHPEDEKAIGSYYDVIKTNCKSNAILYDFAVATGGSFYPAFQSTDPLVGSKYSENDKFDVDLGQCYGHVISWARQIKINGEAKYINLLNRYADEMQKNQIYMSMEPIPSAHIIAERIINSMQFDYIYRVGIYQKNRGHALGIRLIPGTYFIEFFDPNFGLFVLDKNKFADFFELYLSNYRLNYKLNYTEINMSVISTQQRMLAANSVKPRFDSKIMESHTNNKAYDELFMLAEERVTDESGADIKLKEIKKAFVDDMSIRIQYTTNVSVLEKLHRLLSEPKEAFNRPDMQKYRFLARIHGKRHPVFDYMTFRSNEESKSIIALKTKISERIGELRAAAPQNHRRQQLK
ncbi:MAG TPA: hypothetical protein VL360_02485 [Gammaproteobacteria bacterium]|nr:hypothetical protein [Gammaproteobacteria bacterium]